MNRYMPKPYRCNLCFRSFDTVTQAEAHWFDVHAQTTLAVEVRNARPASGTEAQRATIVEQGVVHDGPTGEAGDAHRHD